MKALRQPLTLLAVALLILVGTAYYFLWREKMPGRPVALPVQQGDREIAWLNSATSAASWERFVTAASLCTGAVPGPETFPAQTTAVPQLVIPLGQGKGRLVFRWYKLTSDWKTRDWVEVLLARTPPPLAIIGGSTSDLGADQARQLRKLTRNLAPAQRPLLLLTTATADRVPRVDQDDPWESEADRGSEESGNLHSQANAVRLTELYPGRTFRYCFTNAQMGQAVIRYIWSHPLLRPDTDPIYLVGWQDDSYSSDLISGFWTALRRPMAQTGSIGITRDWGHFANRALTGGFPWEGFCPLSSQFRFGLPPRPYYIPWSVGTFDRPNRFEAAAADYLLDDLDEAHGQQRPLVVLSGQSLPSRRFLRALCRSSPMRARQLVVTTGDAIPFNTIYRDRNVTWPIQDLPCNLVFFCHHNPIDADAGFRPDRGRGSAPATGTEDLLLYADIIQSLYLALGQAPAPANAEDLAQLLRRTRLHRGKLVLEGMGPLLFQAGGERRSASGEHIVWLQPQFRGARVLPQATITVSSWKGETHPWKVVGPPLHVSYNESPVSP